MTAHRRVRSGEQDCAVGLPAAERVPVQIGALGHEQNGVVRGLRPCKQRRVAVGAFVPSKCVDASEAAELAADRRCQPLGIESFRQRSDREDGRPRRGNRQTSGALQLSRELAQEPSRKFRIVGDQGIETFCVQCEQLAVANGPCRGGARGSGQERELAENVAGPELPHDLRAVLAVDEHAQAAGADEVEPVGGIAAAEQVFAATKRDWLRVGREPTDRAAVDAAKERGV